MKKIFLAILTMIMVITFVQPASASSNGKFWLTCLYSHSLSDDPIVHPGESGAAHLHDFFGNRTTDANSTYSDMITGPTNCKYSFDTASYWFPALIKSSGVEVDPISLNAYYWGEKGKTVAFPADFKEVAGVTVGTPMGAHVYYQCMGADDNVYLQLPNCNLTTGKRVKGQIEFPSCWDGVDAYNETSHMIYPDGDVCPADHNISLPRLVEHILWDVKDASNMHLSTVGDEHGETLHADFWNTWNQVELERLIATCVFTGRSCNDLRS